MGKRKQLVPGPSDSVWGSGEDLRVFHNSLSRSAISHKSTEGNRSGEASLSLLSQAGQPDLSCSRCSAGFCKSCLHRMVGCHSTDSLANRSAGVESRRLLTGEEG